MKRREFMRAGAAGSATAAVGVAGAAGTASAQDEEPDWPDEVTDAPNYEETEDMRGEDQVEVQVGAGDGLQFEPAAIWIDEGATVVWEWTGEGGAHNVVSTEAEEEFESDTTEEAGFTFEHTFENEGINAYVCEPHDAQDMHGGVAVGDGIETVEVEEGAVDDPTEMGVQIQEHYVGVGAILMITVSLIFTFFVLKYGESPNAKGGD
jgi:halocyanin-like protein